jgi:Flp pilus assembly protein TadG
MSKNRRVQSRGAGILEFTLVGIPLIFVLISTFEMSRGMWMYHSLAAGVKEATRYAVVHGQNCTLPPNNCGVTISQIATRIQTVGVGLPASDVTLTFTDAGGGATTCIMSDCITNYTASSWPSSTQNAPGLKLQIAGSYAFRSTIIMFWPGAGGGYGPSGTVNLPAVSRESIQF